MCDAFTSCRFTLLLWPILSLYDQIASFVFKRRVVTDGRTDGQSENIMPPPASLAWCTHKRQKDADDWLLMCV